MTGFSTRRAELACDGVSLSAIADVVGTPVYVYSAALLRERYLAIDAAFGGYPHAVHYALKANSSLALVRLLAGLGASADANSIWEIDLARRAGIEPRQTVFTGVGKSPAELATAVALDLKAINVESAGELARIEALAAAAGRVARAAIRINPDIDAASHPHISTGLKASKFGVPLDAAHALALSVRNRPALKLVAIHVHVGSQITAIEPLRRAASAVAEFVGRLRAEGIELEYVDLGGGLGISYDGRPVVNLSDYIATLVDAIRPLGLPIVVEPGRAIVGPTGVLLARVVDMKPRDDGSEFVVIDAGMTELLRPALYGAYHHIEAVRPRAGTPHAYELVGPVCESSDVVGRDRRMAPLEIGDLLAIRDAGAYGAAMASNYNRRPLPAEILVDAGAWRVVKRRQSVDDMLALESP